MKIFFLANIVLSLIAVNTYFVIIKYKVLRKNFKILSLFDHSGNIHDLKILISTEKDELKKQQYSELYFRFKISVYYTIITIVCSLIYYFITNHST